MKPPKPQHIIYSLPSTCCGCLSVVFLCRLRKVDLVIQSRGILLPICVLNYWLPIIIKKSVSKRLLQSKTRLTRFNRNNKS